PEARTMRSVHADPSEKATPIATATVMMRSTFQRIMAGSPWRQAGTLPGTRSGMAILGLYGQESTKGAPESARTAPPASRQHPVPCLGHGRDVAGFGLPVA